jgi:hypothetical protein
MVALDIAAPHQFPYATVLGVPAAVLIASGCRGTPWAGPLAVIAVLRAGWVAGPDTIRLHTILQDPPRAQLTGHPRLLQGRVVYTFAFPRDYLAKIPEERVYTILYDGAEENLSQIPAHPQQGAWIQAGTDRWRGPRLSPPARSSDDERLDKGSGGSPGGPPVPE